MIYEHRLYGIIIFILLILIACLCWKLPLIYSALFKKLITWKKFVFLGYLCLIILFSFNYYLFHNINPRYFALSEDIKKSEIDRLKIERSEAKDRLTLLKEFYLAITNESLLKEVKNVDGISIFLKKEKYLTFSYNASENGVIFELDIYTIDKHYSYRTLDANAHATNLDEAKFILKEKISSEESSISENEKRIEVVEKFDSPHLSYFDLLYFSATLGFGDIAPNTTKTRLLVMFQLLLTLYYFSILISSPYTKENKKIESKQLDTKNEINKSLIPYSSKFENGSVPLKEFLKSKNANNHNKRYLVLAYWYKYYEKTESISKNHIRASYDYLKLQTPKDLTSPFRQHKYRYFYKDSETKIGHYKLTDEGIKEVNQMN